MSQQAPTEKKKNWFSRRHETHESSQAAKRANREKQATGKVHDYSPKTPEERLAVLDARLGVGIGAKKERARLEAIIADEAVLDAILGVGIASEQAQ